MSRVGEVEIDPSILDVLRASTIEGRVLKLPPGQLKRSAYERVDAVLNGMGGKWDRRRGGHFFDFDPSGVVAGAIATGRYVDCKKTLQQFETPEVLAERMAEMAGIETAMAVLEPSAGRGRLCRAALARGAAVAAVELDPLNIDVLRALPRVVVWNADFLEWVKTTNKRFDACLMNPPFTGGQDIAHIMAAWPLLKPGARLVAIASESGFIAMAWQAKRFRAWLIDIGAVVEQLEAGTFRESGTNVRTRLISAVRT